MHSRTSQSRFGSTAALLTIVMSCSLGCARHIYDPRSLPSQYAARGVIDVHSLELARLARTRSDSDIIREGDLVGVTFLTGAPDERPESWPLRVTQNGSVDVPLVGGVAVAGMRLLEAENAIRFASIQRDVFKNPTVSISLKQRRTSRVTVMGAVAHPDTYELPMASADLLSALVAAGGLAENADALVEIHQPRDGPRPWPNVPGASGESLASYSASSSSDSRMRRIDLLEATSGRTNDDLQLVDGAVVMVMSRPKQFVHVLGLVNRPNQVDLPVDQPLRLLDAISQAGGVAMPVADKVYVIRKAVQGDAPPIVVKVSLKDAKLDGPSNMMLSPGDIISIEQTPQTFVWGLLRQFVSFGFGVSGRVPF